MAKKESTQHKLDRVRAPRVQLTYDVEVGDAIEKKELPFVAGVVGNFSGQPAEPLGKLKDRKFVNVDKDNYDDVLKGMKPRVQMQVDNKLAEDGSKLGVELNFRSLEDFSPERVVNQIVPGIIASPAKTLRRSIKVPSLSAFDERPWADHNLVNADHRYAEIICHCEGVTLGEIEEVLGSALPPGSVKALRRRTRAMFGRCQGFYCGARVLQLFQGSGRGGAAD